MLGLSRNERPSKCFLTQGFLPKYTDFKQPPAKGKPFSTVLASPFYHKIDLLLPESLYKPAWPQIYQSINTVKYSRVILNLSDILSGEFFNIYIKTGNVALLSEGRLGVDPVYSLVEGRLKLELPKQLYETAGLVGQPIDDGGRKHIKKRFVVEFDLRHSSMVHGRKGFERLVWAAKNVLTQPLTWLFIDLNGDSHDSDSPLAKQHPSNVTVEPLISKSTVKAPEFRFIRSDLTAAFEEDSLSYLEWLDMVAARSPRVEATDSIDTYLSRYTVPDADGSSEENVVHVSWKGLIPSRWARELLMSSINAAMKKPEEWFSITAYQLSAQTEDSRLGWTILRFPIRSARGRSAEEVMNEPEGGDVAGSTAQPKEDVPAKSTGPGYLLYEMTSK